MERETEIEEYRELFGKNFIGPEELSKIADNLGIQVPSFLPEIHYKRKELEDHVADSVFILGLEQMKNGVPLSILSLYNKFGVDPALHEPCFYNQDWYLNDGFVKTTLNYRWYLIKKHVSEESRAVPPEQLERKFTFPSAILCTYAFFTYWLHAGEILWPNDYIWCSDKDHHGDRIYVGKYLDASGYNKNGFSIHRHLSLRSFHSAISVY